MIETGTNQERIEIKYWDGVNSTVQQGIALRSEPHHAENARAPVIGVLEKREGQTVIGTNEESAVFSSDGEYGLVFHDDDGSVNKGLIRVSSADGIVAGIYFLNADDEWVLIDNDYTNSLSLASCDFVNVDGNLIIVNGSDDNMMIEGEVSSDPTISTSATAGSLYNSPIANKASFYKGRIYLADYYDADGNELKTTILRSSYQMGIVSILSSDVSAADTSENWVLPVTDTKYFYSDPGVASYEIYRGSQKIATITVGDVNETDIVSHNSQVSFETGFTGFLSADEVWIAGTYSGEKKYRWISNASSSGVDVKQYDSFKLSGGDNDAITLMEPVGNVLMIANKDSMMTWNDYTLESFDTGIGCCSKKGYVKRGALYFLDYSGFFSTTGGVPKLLSRRVEKFFNGATKAGLEAGAVGWKGLSIFCTIGDVTLYKNDGSVWKTLSDVCMEYTTADQNWYVHTNVSAIQFAKYATAEDVDKITTSSMTSSKNEILGAEMITNGGFSDTISPWKISGDEWVYSPNNVVLTIT